MYGFPDLKILWKYTQESNTVDFDDWPPVDLQMVVLTSSDIWLAFYCQIWIPRCKKNYEKIPIGPQQYLLMIDLQWTSNYDLQWQLWPPVTFEQYSSDRYGFPDTKNLWKDTHKSNTVDFNDWPPVDLQLWPPNGSYDLQWHLSSILVPDLDSPIPKTYEKTPVSPMQ